MRFFLSGPRFFGIRPGILFSPNELIRHRYKYAIRIKGTFVYVIRGEHNLVKIGVTTNPSARIAALRTASAFPLDFSFIGATQDNGLAIESEAHRLLSGYACSGEWFDTTPEKAILAVIGAAAKLGHPIKAVSEREAALILQALTYGEQRPKLHLIFIPIALLIAIAWWAAYWWISNIIDSANIH